MPLPITDGVVTLRAVVASDTATLVAGRDAESRRFLGDGDPDPRPVACIEVDGSVIGWVDHDHDRSWLGADEVNVGYQLVAEHRGRGYATRAVGLLLSHLADDTAWRVATLLIDRDNARSLALARRLGVDRRADLDGHPYFGIVVDDPIVATAARVTAAMHAGAEVVIRAARIDDAAAMGRLHVRAWQHAYRGMMPDASLDELSADDRTAMWTEIVAEPVDERAPIIVAAIGDDVVGFAVAGAAGVVDGGPSIGRLFALNLDPIVWRYGIGRRLLRAATVRLAAAGHDEAMLWVVDRNDRARTLYESEGWSPDGATSTDDVLGVPVHEVRLRRRLR
jgi:RimJ/RimL family protein N-acetyltransferase